MSIILILLLITIKKILKWKPVGKEWDNGILGKKGKKEKEKDFEKERKMTWRESNQYANWWVPKYQRALGVKYFIFEKQKKTWGG
jgi:hypothetical protein